MIERNIWRLLQLVLALDPKVEADSLKIAEMRKMHGTGLLNECRSIREKMHVDLQAEFNALLVRLEDGMLNRHMAVHGVWASAGDGEGFRVEYLWNRGTRKAPDWVMYGEVVSWDEVEFAVEDAADLVAAIDRLVERQQRLCGGRTIPAWYRLDGSQPIED